MRAWALGRFHSHISTRTFRRSLDSCAEIKSAFSGVTKSGRVWRKVPESDARSVTFTYNSPHTFTHSPTHLSALRPALSSKHIHTLNHKLSGFSNSRSSPTILSTKQDGNSRECFRKTLIVHGFSKTTEVDYSCFKH